MANIAAIRFIAFFAGLLGVIFLIVALPTHHWYHHRPYGTNETAITGLHVEEVYGGIFEKCEKMSDSSYSCRATNGNGYLKSTKAFLLLGIVGFAVVTIYTLVFAFTRGICYRLLGALTILTAFFIMVGMSIYTDQNSVEGENSEYGWSFSLGWASFVFTLLAGLLAFFGSVEYEKI